MSDRNPASVLLTPNRPTTATTSHPIDPPSASFRFLSSPQLHANSSPPFESPSSFAPIPNLLPLFAKYPVHRANRGTVRIRVESTAFYVHREILILSSPFFESVITGGWKETEPRQPRKPRRLSNDGEAEAAPAPAAETDDGSGGGGATPRTPDSRTSFETSNTSPDNDTTTFTTTSVDVDSSPPLPALDDVNRTPRQPHSATQATPSPPASESGDPAPSMTASYISSSVMDDDEDSEEDTEGEDDVICRLRLVEEKAASFQALLCHLYPRLECLISWNNVGDLCRMASKFDLPSLRNATIAFLLPSAAGKPVEGMRIAEEMNIPELYKEASRYTLDNYHNWPPEELAMLSQPTLLKLERRRSWFLERLLKLGLVQTSRDYVCAPTCPDHALCARLVDEKWRSAWSSAFRFGTPQPSIIYRSLRNLEPSLSSPALHLPHTACQAHARLYVADLFDRMFGIGVQTARSWGALTLNGTSSAGGLGRTFGPHQDGIAKNSARYFLSIDMAASP
ncbi:hypothetical protein RQP46_000714 [Phenoliferia psychrophenolica]